MNFSKSISNMAVLIEFLAGSGMAIFFHFVLHSPELAYGIFGVGILLSLATYLIREDLEKTRQELIGQYQQAHEVTFAIAQIGDAECHSKAEAMMSGVKRSIVQLQQGFIPLDETEFYLEGAKCSDLAVRRLKTVDPINIDPVNNGCHTRGHQSTAINPICGRWNAEWPLPVFLSWIVRSWMILKPRRPCWPSTMPASKCASSFAKSFPPAAPWVGEILTALMTLPFTTIRWSPKSFSKAAPISGGRPVRLAMWISFCAFMS